MLSGYCLQHSIGVYPSYFPLLLLPHKTFGFLGFQSPALGLVFKFCVYLELLHLLFNLICLMSTQVKLQYLKWYEPYYFAEAAYHGVQSQTMTRVL